MKISPKALIFASIAVASGLIVLLGYFFAIPILVNLRAMILHWAVLLAAVALLVGILNLARVHWRKIITRQSGFVYSSLLLLSLVVTLIIAGFFGPTHPWARWIFDYVQVPIESSLMAIMAIILVYACVRLLSRRLNLFSIIFICTVLIILIGTVSLVGFEIPGMPDLRAWIVRVWAVGGARGILLGVALGTVATGLRILMGSDRPYGG